MISLLSILMIAGTAQGQNVKSSAHDLGFAGSGANTWDGGSTEVCVYCHTPHGAQLSVAAPLFNRTGTGQTYAMYTSSTFTSSAIDAQPAGISLACLTCHDGNIATGTGTINPGTNGAPAPGAALTGNINLGASLVNDHPISIDYAAAIASGSGLNAGPTSPLFNGKVECASCHNVHDDTNPKFLLTTNNRSALCLDCHNK